MFEGIALPGRPFIRHCVRSWIKLPAHPFVRTEGPLLTHPLQNCCLHTPNLSQGQAQCLHKPRLKNKAIGFRVQ